MIGTARVSWFSLDKKFGFVSLDGTAADAFLHLSVLKSAGYVAVPAGTSMQVSVETDRAICVSWRSRTWTPAPLWPVSLRQS
jgi:cold shock CspA family protein